MSTSAFIESKKMTTKRSGAVVHIRVDGGPSIGSGHIVRCIAIAREIEKLGASASFISSDQCSGDLVRSYGYDATLLGGNPGRLSGADALSLVSVAGVGKTVLVDSYGITDEFFDACAKEGLQVAYIDDMYTFETGPLEKPVKRNVHALINYGFGFTEEDYRRVYMGSPVQLFIGPKYAPVRKVFREKAKQYSPREKLENVLITTGSTNPDRCLELLAEGCRKALPDVRISVVIGGNALFDRGIIEHLNLEVIEEATDLSDYMLESDLVISAAGTTLYELCVLGIPTIAVPIVENQLINARGFARMGYGITIDDPKELSKDVLEKASHALIGSKREELLLSGFGSTQIAEALLE